MKVAGGIEVGIGCVVGTTGAICSQQSCLPGCCRTRVCLIAERPPKGEVNIEGSLNLDGNVASNTHPHVIPERMFGRG